MLGILRSKSNIEGKNVAAATANKTIAYLRVSALDQGIEKNKADIVYFANQRDICRRDCLRAHTLEGVLNCCRSIEVAGQ